MLSKGKPGASEAICSFLLMSNVQLLNNRFLMIYDNFVPTISGILKNVQWAKKSCPKAAFTFYSFTTMVSPIAFIMQISETLNWRNLLPFIFDLRLSLALVSADLVSALVSVASVTITLSLT
jgi:hypothetical protein